jgi:hypothetical protein
MLRHGLSGLCLLLLVGPASAQTQLKWNFQENAKFYQRTDTALKQSMRVMGRDTKQEMNYVTVLSSTVLRKSPDGSVVLEQKIEAMEPKKAEGGEAAAGVLAELVGSSFRITLSPQMQVMKFEGYEDLVKKLSRDDPTATKTVRAMMPEETLRRSAEEAFAFLPEGKVNRGDKWERRLTVPLGPLGNLAAVYQYTYEGPERVDGQTLEKIAVTANLTYQAPKGEGAGLPFQVTKSDLRAETASGSIYFDATRGRLVRSSMTLRLKGTLTISAMGQEFPLEMEQDQTVRMVLSDQNPGTK